MNAQIIKNSAEIGQWNNGENQNSLHYVAVKLFRHRDGKFFLSGECGAAMASTGSEWISEANAKRFLRDHAFDLVTGHGFEPKEIEAACAGDQVEPTGSYPESNRPDPYSPWGLRYETFAETELAAEPIDI